MKPYGTCGIINPVSKLYFLPYVWLRYSVLAVQFLAVLIIRLVNSKQWPGYNKSSSHFAKQISCCLHLDIGLHASASCLSHLLKRAAPVWLCLIFHYRWNISVHINALEMEIVLPGLLITALTHRRICSWILCKWLSTWFIVFALKVNVRLI